MRDQWQNAKGETVTIHNCGCLTVGKHQHCRCRAPRVPAANQRRRDVVQALHATVQQVERQVQRHAAAHGMQLVRADQIAGTYLTPDGVLVASLKREQGRPQYSEPVSPWAKNEAQLTALREQVREAEGWLEANPGAPWSERTRQEENVKSLRRELTTAEFEQQLQRRRQQLG